MAKRGPPSKVHELLPSGRTRAQAACDLRRKGGRNKHCAMAADVEESTLYRWIADDEDGFRSLYAKATSEGVGELLDGARGLVPDLDWRAALELLQRCHGYHHSVPDAAPAEQGSDALTPEALDGLLAVLAERSPQKLRKALERASGRMNREGEAGPAKQEA